MGIIFSSLNVGLCLALGTGGFMLIGMCIEMFKDPHNFIDNFFEPNESPLKRMMNHQEDEPVKTMEDNIMDFALECCCSDSDSDDGRFFYDERSFDNDLK